MKYACGDTYPYEMSDLRKDNPLTSFPKNALEKSVIRADFNVREVEETAKPSKSGHKAVASTKEVDGKLVEEWSFVPKLLEELDVSEIVATDSPVSLGSGWYVEPYYDGKLAQEGTPEYKDGEWRQTWTVEEPTDYVINRSLCYGRPELQLEYICENGIEAWQTKVAEIKARFPK